ncbi:MAG: hypothetical protein LKM38_22240 [Pseudomonas veronii]|jgi:hypothetical protein|nr:hypothetical protein [Pseudomonas veronii]
MIPGEFQIQPGDIELNVGRKSAAKPMPRCSAPPSATASAWPTPSLFVEVERDFTDLRRRGQIRRRQGHPRRHGPEPALARLVDTVITNALIIDALGHRQGRHRHQARAHRGHRQGGQSRISSPA